MRERYSKLTTRGRIIDSHTQIVLFFQIIKSYFVNTGISAEVANQYEDELLSALETVAKTTLIAIKDVDPEMFIKDEIYRFFHSQDITQAHILPAGKSHVCNENVHADIFIYDNSIFMPPKSQQKLVDLINMNCDTNISLRYLLKFLDREKLIVSDPKSDTKYGTRIYLNDEEIRVIEINESMLTKLWGGIVMNTYAPIVKSYIAETGVENNPVILVLYEAVCKTASYEESALLVHQLTKYELLQRNPSAILNLAISCCLQNYSELLVEDIMRHWPINTPETARLKEKYLSHLLNGECRINELTDFVGYIEAYLASSAKVSDKEIENFKILLSELERRTRSPLYSILKKFSAAYLPYSTNTEYLFFELLQEHKEYRSIPEPAGLCSYLSTLCIQRKCCYVSQYDGFQPFKKRNPQPISIIPSSDDNSKTFFDSCTDEIIDISGHTYRLGEKTAKIIKRGLAAEGFLPIRRLFSNDICRFTPVFYDQINEWFSLAKKRSRFSQAKKCILLENPAVSVVNKAVIASVL